MSIRRFYLLLLGATCFCASPTHSLSASSTTVCSTRPHAWVAALAPRLDASRGEVPLALLLGWIEVESGGDLHSTTSLDERGYFQLMPAESKDLGVDHARLGYDSDYSLDAGVILVRHYEKQAESLGYAQSDKDFWRIVKFQHAMGANAVAKLLREMGENPNRHWSWQDIERFSIANRVRVSRQIGHDPVKWIKNVDKVMAAGTSLELEWQNRKCNTSSSKAP